MAEGGGPERELRHERHIDNDGHCKTGQGYPQGHIGLSGKLVPHRDIEKHPEEHIGQEHHRDHSHSGAEILSDNEGEYVQIEEYPYENQSAESREELHHDGVELLRALVAGPLEEERLGCEAEHLDEEVHYDGKLDRSLEYAQAGTPGFRVSVEISEKNPVEEVIDNTRQSGNHKRDGIGQHLPEQFRVELEGELHKVRDEEEAAYCAAYENRENDIGEIRCRGDEG